MAPESPDTKSKGEAAYDEISQLIAKKWNGLELEERIDLALNLVSALTTQVVRISMSVAVQQGSQEVARCLNDVGDAIGSAIADGYRDGSDGVCPCGKCAPLEVNVDIYPTPQDKLDPTPAKPGTMVN